MLEKFIELVEHQVEANKLACEIEECSTYWICSLDRIQLMDESQELFDKFCDRFNLRPRVTIDTEYDPPQRTQLVRYKDILIYVFGDAP